MPASNTVTDGRLPSVQALRAIAVLLVVLVHSNKDIFVGFSGVDLFFVISGFIMVYTNRDNFGNPGAIKPFLLKRVLRIYPTYWIATLLVLTVIKWPTYHRYFTSFLLIPTENPPILPPGWTLFHEIGFYILFALCLVFPMRKAIVVVCLVLASLVCLRVVFIDIFPITWGKPLALEFAMGSIVGYAYCKGMRIGRPLSLALMAIGLVLVFMPAIFDSLTQYYLFRPVFWGGGGTLIFVGVVFGPEIRHIDNRVVQLLGDASYSIYVAHFTIVLGLLYNPYRGVATFVVSIIFGLGFYAMIERPLMAALKRRFSSRLRVPQAATGTKSVEPVFAAEPPAPALSAATVPRAP